MKDAPTPPQQSETPTHGLQAAIRRPWWKRLIADCFHWHGETPPMPEWAKDGIMSNIDISFDWKDRIRILLTGRVHVRGWIPCEHPPGKVETFASVCARPPRCCE